MQQPPIQIDKRINLISFNKHYKAWSSRRNLNEYQKEIFNDVHKEMRKLIRQNPDEAANMLVIYYMTCGGFGGG